MLMPGAGPGVVRRTLVEEELRETMVPKSALEWLVAFVPYCPSDGPYPDDCPAETNSDGDVCTRCWVSAALRAAEEADSNAD